MDIVVEILIRERPLQILMVENLQNLCATSNNNPRARYEFKKRKEKKKGATKGFPRATPLHIDRAKSSQIRTTCGYRYEGGGGGAAR